MLMDYVQISSEFLFNRFFIACVGPPVLAASVLILGRSPRLGYITAALGATLPLFWILKTESRDFFNSWIAMNGSFVGASRYMRFALLRIIAVTLLLPILFLAVTRLLPVNWQLRGRPINQRSWPAVLGTLTCITYWFIAFVSPYREPIIVDAAQPEIAILHVEKDGIDLRETCIRVGRDGRYLLARADRRLFHYAFLEAMRTGLLTDQLRSKLKVIQALPELKQVSDRTPSALRVHRGDGWYTETGSVRVAAFTTENGTKPPPELVNFFREVEGTVSSGEVSVSEVRDVCLGFCYDPKAGLGYRAENQRCGYGLDYKERCY